MHVESVYVKEDWSRLYFKKKRKTMKGQDYKLCLITSWTFSDMWEYINHITCKYDYICCKLYNKVCLDQMFSFFLTNC
ncbi:hypothetical protein CARUB_v10010799mg [Capsella rubella]|uniref:Uncharacterized protein n=1 Tax=Capsella rubella TaxID=81985 RepID=R0IJV1_9BRAS|nr:hypothetical protein CARUB_v10010799mg [Capsella rubella]